MSRRASFCLFLGLLSLFLGLSLGGRGAMSAQQPAPPLVRENATIRLAEHVWAIPDFNAGAVTGLGPRNGAIIVHAMNRVSRNGDVNVVMTHFHPEHALGASAFVGAKVVMARVQQQEMQELGAGMKDFFAGRSSAMAGLLAGVQYPKADILFDTEHH